MTKFLTAPKDAVEQKIITNSIDMMIRTLRGIRSAVAAHNATLLYWIYQARAAINHIELKSTSSLLLLFIIIFFSVSSDTKLFKHYISTRNN